MLAKKLTVVFASLLCLLLTSTSAFACACCVDPGYYEITTARSSFYERDFLGEMKFDAAFQLYETVAGFDVIRGLDDLKKDEDEGKSIDLNIVETFLARAWRLKVNTASGRKGSLVLPMPVTMVRYKVDLHDNAPGTETSLYKELRFKGTVGSGSGIFKRAGTKPTSYFLVFQGRGNGCDSWVDFTRWRLEIIGPKVRYAFFGKLNSSNYALTRLE